MALHKEITAAVVLSGRREAPEEAATTFGNGCGAGFACVFCESVLGIKRAKAAIINIDAPNKSNQFRLVSYFRRVNIAMSDPNIDAKKRIKIKIKKYTFSPLFKTS